jgi:hypothetical protein
MPRFQISKPENSMKVKITQGGWSSFCGHLGQVLFENGVSVEDVGKGDAAFLAGILQIEEVGTGHNPSNTQRILDQYKDAAAVEKKEEPVVEQVVQSGEKLTKEALEQIADTKGIKGLREIAEPMGIKGLSITELIEKILSNNNK